MSYSELDNSLQDLEKHYSSDESDHEYSTTSSRYSMHSDTRILSAGRYRSHKPIFEELSPRRTRHHRSRIRFPLFRQTLCLCTPRKVSRYFTLILLSTIVVLVLTLTKLSWNSSRSVRLGLHKAKPPPP